MLVTFAVGFMMKSSAAANAVSHPVPNLKIYPKILLAPFAAPARTNSLKSKALTLAISQGHFKLKR